MWLLLTTLSLLCTSTSTNIIYVCSHMCLSKRCTNLFRKWSEENTLFTVVCDYIQLEGTIVRVTIPSIILYTLVDWRWIAITTMTFTFFYSLLFSTICKSDNNPPLLSRCNEEEKRRKKESNLNGNGTIRGGWTKCTASCEMRRLNYWIDMAFRYIYVVLFIFIFALFCHFHAMLNEKVEC